MVDVYLHSISAVDEGAIIKIPQSSKFNFKTFPPTSLAQVYNIVSSQSCGPVGQSSLWLCWTVSQFADRISV